MCCRFIHCWLYSNLCCPVVYCLFLCDLHATENSMVLEEGMGICIDLRGQGALSPGLYFFLRGCSHHICDVHLACTPREPPMHTLSCPHDGSLWWLAFPSPPGGGGGRVLASLSVLPRGERVVARSHPLGRAMVAYVRWDHNKPLI